MVLARLKEVIRAVPGARSIWGALHYLKFQYDLRKEEASYARRRPRDEYGFPLPPPRLRFRVSNTFSEDNFVDVGIRASSAIRESLASLGHDLDHFRRILDFGCGCGRVIRFIRPHARSCQLHGCDIDAEAIGWCNQNLGAMAIWSCNPPSVPLDYPENHFDLIYGISVFTHLNEGMQFFWLGELYRVAKPGALLLLTVHGETLATSLARQGQLSNARMTQLERAGILFYDGQRGTLKLDGLPDFYQTAFHRKAYITTYWTRYFELLRHIERDHQDIVILRKRNPVDTIAAAGSAGPPGNDAKSGDNMA